MAHEMKKAVAIGVAGLGADVAATSGWMHRGYAHKNKSGFRLHPVLEHTARTVIWGTGVKPRDWAWIHRTHHDYADQPQDPHSPDQQGRYGILKVFLKNAGLYRSKGKELNEHPENRPKDLMPTKADKLYDRTKLGLATSFAGYVVLNKAVGNPARYAAVSFAVEKLTYIGVGGLVNGIGHSGKRPLHALVTGRITPHEDGTKGADSLLVGAVTGGEGMQKYHHEHEGSVYFGPDTVQGAERVVRDPIGVICLKAADVGLAHYEEVESLPTAA